MRSLVVSTVGLLLLFTGEGIYQRHVHIAHASTCTISNPLSTTLPTGSVTIAGIESFIVNKANDKIFYQDSSGCCLRSVDYPAMTNDALLAGSVSTGAFAEGTGSSAALWKPKVFLMSPSDNIVYGSTQGGGGLGIAVETAGVNTGAVTRIAGQNGNDGQTDGDFDTNTAKLWNSMTWFSSIDNNRIIVTQTSMIRMLDLRGNKPLTTLAGTSDNSALLAGFGLNARLRFVINIVSYRGGVKFYAVSTSQKVFISYDWATTLVSIIGTNNGAATTLQNSLTAGQSTTWSGTHNIELVRNGMMGPDCIWYLVSTSVPGALWGVDIENDQIYLLQKEAGKPYLDVQVLSGGSANTPSLLVRAGSALSTSTNGEFISGTVVKHASCPTDLQCGLSASASESMTFSATVVPPTPVPPTPNPPVPIPPTPAPTAAPTPAPTAATTQSTTADQSATTAQPTTATSTTTLATTVSPTTTTTISSVDPSSTTPTTTSADPNLLNANASPQVPADNSSSLSTGALAGIVVGGIVLIAVIVGVLVYVLVIAKKGASGSSGGDGGGAKGLEDETSASPHREVMASIVPGADPQESSIFHDEQASSSNPLAGGEAEKE